MRFFLLFAILISSLFFSGAFNFPPQHPPQTTLLTGTIASIPEAQSHSIAFMFIPSHRNEKIFLRWYYPPPVQLHIGDQWMLNIALQPAWQNWLLTQNINGIGTIKFDYKNQILLNNQKKCWDYPIQKTREAIYAMIKNTLQHKTGLGFISALTIGMRDHITQTQWDDLRGTGTNHLMAIGGLHIGFMFGFIFFIANKAWRMSETLMLWRPAQEASLFIGLSGAVLYAVLSGFAIPAKRAIIMLGVFVLATLSRRKINLLLSYFISLVLVIFIHPLSVFTPTFWLSFTAVFLLIYAMGGRVGKVSTMWHGLRAQWVMAIGLIPLNLLFFQQLSWIGFFGNLIAIPFVGFIILPLCIAGIAFHPFWIVAEYLLMHFWIIMHGLAQLPHAQYYHTLSPATLLKSSVGILLILAPREFPARYLGWFWLITIFWN